MESTSQTSRNRWAGRLGAAFYLAGGGLSLLTLPLAAADANVTALTIVAIVAIAVGAVAWFVRWDRLPGRASLVLVPPALGLIAAGNALGGSDYFTYAIYFLLVFAWLGFAHPPWTSLLVAPFAALAYVLPLWALPEPDRSTGLASAVVVLPIGILVGEALARGMQRVIRIESDLQRERELREVERRLDAMKTTFIRAASHELRTPITVCRGHLDVLDPTGDPEETAQTLALVVDELDRMGRLVGDLALLTRLEDPDALRLEAVPADELVGEVLAKARPLLDGRLSVGGVAPGSVTSDRQRLNQALLGLLENAAAHGGGDARVSLSALRERGGWRFEVTDGGVGLGDLDPSTLLQPFVHGPGSEGTGLGLAIVRSIARAHGGDAGIEARPLGERGATAWIRIPG